MPKAYIVAQSAISYRRYITRSLKERISLGHLPYGGCPNEVLFLINVNIILGVNSLAVDNYLHVAVVAVGVAG